ncbi:MAG: hypothetical protein ACI9YT_000002 [Halobacteriales archaeon]|jgi:hypothetical protein
MNTSESIGANLPTHVAGSPDLGAGRSAFPRHPPESPEVYVSRHRRSILHELVAEPPGEHRLLGERTHREPADDQYCEKQRLPGTRGDRQSPDPCGVAGDLRVSREPERPGRVQPPPLRRRTPPSPSPAASTGRTRRTGRRAATGGGPDPRPPVQSARTGRLRPGDRRIAVRRPWDGLRRESFILWIKYNTISDTNVPGGQNGRIRTECFGIREFQSRSGTWDREPKRRNARSHGTDRGRGYARRNRRRDRTDGPRQERGGRRRRRHLPGPGIVRSVSARRGRGSRHDRGVGRSIRRGPLRPGSRGRSGARPPPRGGVRGTPRVRRRPPVAPRGRAPRSCRPRPRSSRR